MVELSILRHEEGVRLDPDKLVELYARFGSVEAEAIISRSVEDLVKQVAEIERSAADDCMAGILSSAARMKLVAGDIGMTTLARVAGDMADTTAYHDTAGQAAVLSRLSRIADRSMSEIWDLRRASL